MALDRVTAADHVNRSTVVTDAGVQNESPEVSSGVPTGPVGLGILNKTVAYRDTSVAILPYGGREAMAGNAAALSSEKVIPTWTLQDPETALHKRVSEKSDTQIRQKKREQKRRNWRRRGKDQGNRWQQEDDPLA